MVRSNPIDIGGGGGSTGGDGGGTDPSDPSDAPSASPPDQGADPDDPRDAPSASPPTPAPEPDPPSGGGSSGGVVDRVTSTVGDTVSGAGNVADSVGGTVTDTIDTVQGGVNRVEETLPGPTGTAFATGAAVAAVPEPTPVTETTGAAIAGGAALVGGGVLASRAIRNRGSELGIGERVTSELGIGQQNQDVTEVGVGEQLTSEVGVGETGPSTTEVGIGSTTSVSELDVGAGGSQATISAAEQVGIGSPTGEASEVDSEDEQVEIEDPIDDTGEIARQTFEQKQYEVQEIYGNEQYDSVPERERVENPGPFNDARDAGISGAGEPETFGNREETFGERFNRLIQDDDPGQVTRDPVRFPADEAATGTAPSLLEEQLPEFSDPGATSVGTATGVGGATDLILAGGDEQGGDTGPDTIADEVTGAGIDPTTGDNPASGSDPFDASAIEDQLGGPIGGGELPADATGINTGNDTGSGSGNDIDNDTGSDTGNDTDNDTGPGSETGLGTEAVPVETTVTATQPQVQTTNQVTEPIENQLQSEFGQANDYSGPTTPGNPTGSGDPPRRRPRPDPKPDDSDAPQPLVFAQDSDSFGSGILSGAEAVDRLFGR